MAIYIIPWVHLEANTTYKGSLSRLSTNESALIVLAGKPARYRYSSTISTCSRSPFPVQTATALSKKRRLLKLHVLLEICMN